MEMLVSWSLLLLSSSELKYHYGSALTLMVAQYASYVYIPELPVAKNPEAEKLLLLNFMMGIYNFNSFKERLENISYV
jgi:hypothetical protein